MRPFWADFGPTSPFFRISFLEAVGEDVTIYEESLSFSEAFQNLNFGGLLET